MLVLDLRGDVASKQHPSYLVSHHLCGLGDSCDDQRELQSPMTMYPSKLDGVRGDDLVDTKHFTILPPTLSLVR